ncbi:hypothetical protein AB0I77_20105 [Streptomyces sp. NPDC050619]
MNGRTAWGQITHGPRAASARRVLPAARTFSYREQHCTVYF